MPVHSSSCSDDDPISIASPHAKPFLVDSERGCDPITIGLINNMPDAAFKATEGQFVSLLEAASRDDLNIILRLYLLPEIPRKALSANDTRKYLSAETLLDSRLDGLIVTGREPMMQELTEECYWERFTVVLEWARDNTYSAIWSCLAAHAAVLHLDGIRRQRNEKKYSGVMECERVSEHRLNANTPCRFHVPHSRY